MKQYVQYDETTETLNKIVFQEPLIYRGSQNTTILDLLEQIGISPGECSDLVRTFPQMVEFPMFTLLFANRIPS